MMVARSQGAGPRVNYGIHGFKKMVVERDGIPYLRFRTANAAEKPRQLKLRTFEQEGFVVVANHETFGGCDLGASLRQDLSRVEVLAPPFDKSLDGYFKENFLFGAIFYDLKHGKLDELNRAIRDVAATQFLGTPFLVSGNKEDEKCVKRYEFLDFYTKVTPAALKRNISEMETRWQQGVARFNGVLNHGRALLLLLHAKDNYAALHSQGVDLIARLIGEKLGLSPLELEFLRIGAIFYDLGKLAIYDDILTKPGRLTATERALMQQHPGHSVELVDPLLGSFGPESRQKIVEMARDHHSGYDGRGYPKLDKAELSILTHVIAGADLFDAATTKRLHKEAGRTLDDVRGDIKRSSGHQLHPVVAQALLELLDEGISVEMQMSILNFPLSASDPLAGGQWHKIEERQKLVRALTRLSQLEAFRTAVLNLLHDLRNLIAPFDLTDFTIDQIGRVVLNLKGILSGREGVRGEERIPTKLDELLLGEEMIFNAAIAILEESCLDIAGARKAASQIGKLMQIAMKFGQDDDGEKAKIFSPSEEANDASELMQAMFKNKNVSFVLEGGSEIPDLHGSPIRFRRILLNLLTNALQATEEGGSVTLVTSREDGGVRIEVRDTGCGIKPEHRERVFNPFFSTKEEGRGLGMAGVKNQVEEFGGEISFDTKEGKGTTFILKFPPAQSDELT